MVRGKLLWLFNLFLVSIFFFFFFTFFEFCAICIWGGWWLCVSLTSGRLLRTGFSSSV